MGQSALLPLAEQRPSPTMYSAASLVMSRHPAPPAAPGALSKCYTVAGAARELNRKNSHRNDYGSISRPNRLTKKNMFPAVMCLFWSTDVEAVRPTSR